ncbi:uncharacterized protein P884DRAFT_213338 [Thermothelomyces heterothallicus CBS 202.75]|uniref:uncharacterized protein n=1 Tax=Thermothelomyces heterothallicus CBS 202.75 TaxID=1149848 RepID=UPI003743BA03
MPYKPLRQIAAEKARGNKPANPSQLGDPVDLKAETSDEPDEEFGSPSQEQVDGIGTKLSVPRSSLEADPNQKGEEKGIWVGLGDGAGPIGGVRKKGSKL